MLITTTTAIYNPDEKRIPLFFLEDIKDFQPTDGTITIFGQKIVGEKLIGVSLEKVR